MLPMRPGLSRQLSAASMQVPMISSPLKQTNEIDWVQPLKAHIRSAYSDDPERYTDECAALNRLRQDMRGAGKDSAAGRDLLYRYYGQLEYLDLRFPIDENHIKISFTWFDAFTLKPTSQYSLAFEKASIIFNISAVLSCHAAFQNRHEETGLKTAYHSFQASAGMFTYINENFLHAPSTDLSRETVKTLINIMLAQGQEVFIEKQVVDKKKPGLLAKLAAQAAFLYAQAVEGVQENVTSGVFERVWMLVVQIKQHHIASIAQYYQAIADYEANNYGQAISRLLAAEKANKEASRIASGFPSAPSANSNLSAETGAVLADMAKKQTAAIQELLTEYNRDNDMIYHQPVPSESNLPSIPKLPAAKAIPVSELYQGQDIQRIIGSDIFQRIVPMAVTESASLYDEEKAKLVRAEAERVETADDELTTSLDYLQLPGSLKILKGGLDQDGATVDDEFRRWCSELSGHDPFSPVFDTLRDTKQKTLGKLDQCSKQLDLEEGVCEKMRSKYGADWTQQPSSRLTSTLRTDIRSYRAAIEEASTSDAQLYSTSRQHESDMDEMRSAGETDEADVLYQRAMIKAGAGKQMRGGLGGDEGNLLDDDFADDHRQSVAQQIERVEELMHKLQLVKRERQSVLKDLKDKVHNDDISSVLILNKKAITDQDNQLFKNELEKFRAHQNRILQANHKQSAIMKDLTRTYGELLQDKRIRSEQNKYEAFSRQRNAVLGKYRKVFQAFNDLQAGLSRAKQFYDDMKMTVDNLHKNVETFVENRRSEGGQLLNTIETSKGSSADREQARMKELMERMSLSPASQPTASPLMGGNDHRPAVAPRPPPLSNQSLFNSQAAYTPASPPATPRYPPNGLQSPGFPNYSQNTANGHRSRDSYQPATYGSMTSPSPQPYFNAPPNQQQYGGFSTNNTAAYGQTPQPQQPGGQYVAPSMPQGWQPPPPPPGPPPSTDYSAINNRPYPAGPGGYAHDPRRQGSQAAQSNPDPWAGLNSWK